MEARGIISNEMKTNIVFLQVHTDYINLLLSIITENINYTLNTCNNQCNFN